MNVPIVNSVMPIINLVTIIANYLHTFNVIIKRCAVFIFTLLKQPILYTLFLLILISLTVTSANAIFVYDASTLHNAASRSQTIQQMFYQRWDTVIHNYLRFDAYVNINWVYDFHVNTYNRGTGTTQAVPMRLVRTFSNMILFLPVYTPASAIQSDTEETQTIDINDISTFRNPWVHNSVLLGFTLCGYHYGLTRSLDINRGSAGNESASDYAFSQFFDDIAAITLYFVPYATLHAGVLLYQQIEPNPDGTLDYNFNPSSIPKRYFGSLSIFNVLTWRSTAAKDRLESSDVSVALTQLLILGGKASEWIPDITIGYKRFSKYNDQPYDPVWVSTAHNKSNSMSDSLKQSATLYTYYTTLSKSINAFTFAANIEFQHVDATLIDKRDEKKLDLPLIRQWWIKAGYDLLDLPGCDLILWLGVSTFYDPAISFHSTHSDNDTTGWFAVIDAGTPYITLLFKASYNDSAELEKLVEAVDKYILEASASIRI